MPDLKIIKTIVNASLAFLGKKIDSLGEKISLLKKDDVESVINNQAKILSSVVSRIEKAINKIQEPKFSGEIIVNISSLERELSEIAKDLNKLLKKETPNLKNTEFLLKQMTNEIKSISPEKNLKEINNSLEAILKALGGIKPIDTFKLDDMQLRKLAGASRGINVDGGNMAARNVAITNLALTAPNTQYSFTFPANTTAFTIKLRDQGTLAYYSFTTGTLPAIGGGGDGSKYATIPQNYLQSQEGVDWSGKIIYLGAESASQTAEITVYTM